MDEARRLDDVLQEGFVKHPYLMGLVPPYHDVVAVGAHTITYRGTYDGLEHEITYAPDGIGAIKVG